MRVPIDNELGSDSTVRREDSTPYSVVGVAVGMAHPSVSTRPVLDLDVLDQARLFDEAHRQSQPLVEAGSPTKSRVGWIVRNGSARRHGILTETAEGYSTSRRPPAEFLKGANPNGKAAEVVAASDYRRFHAGEDPGIVNPPKRVAPNVKDIRLSPDDYSRKDFLFGFETKSGDVVWKYNGQVKTGNPTYVANSLVEMAQKNGYGKVAYVNSRLVNPDGTPKVGPDAFTAFEARQLQEANVELRGIPDLEGRAALLNENLRAWQQDGLDPVARKQLEQLRDDISTAYQAKGIAGRLAGGAALGAASAAVVSIVVQLATDGELDAGSLGQAVGTGAAFGTGGVAADAGIYHIATKAMGMLPEAAKSLAQQGVATGFCAIAIGTDLLSEVRAAKRGELTTAEAVSGTAAKMALDLLPLVLAPLGLVGLPIVVGTQLGGRYLIAKLRQADRALCEAGAEGLALADRLECRMTAFDESVSQIEAESAKIQELYRCTMQGSGRNQIPCLRLV